MQEKAATISKLWKIIIIIITANVSVIFETPLDIQLGDTRVVTEHITREPVCLK